MITVSDLIDISKTAVNLCDIDTGKSIDFPTGNEIDASDCEVLNIEARVTDDGIPEAMVIDAYIKVPTTSVSVDICVIYRATIDLDIPIDKDIYDYSRDYVRNLMDDAPYYVNIAGVDFEIGDYDHDIW